MKGLYLSASGAIQGHHGPLGFEGEEKAFCIQHISMQELSLYMTCQLGFSNSAANKDMMSKVWTNWDTVI